MYQAVLVLILMNAGKELVDSNSVRVMQLHQVFESKAMCAYEFTCLMSGNLMFREVLWKLASRLSVYKKRIDQSPIYIEK